METALYRAWANRGGRRRSPHLSGLLAPFPIITSVLAIFTYAHDGRPGRHFLLRNFLLGFYGFAVGYRAMDEREALKVMVKP